jgi:hypothetical protein
MSLKLKKIYVDTRYRTLDSVSTSNFKIELPYSVVLPDNSTFQLTDICIEHSWLTVETGINDTIYIRALSYAGPQEQIFDVLVVLPSQNYTGPTLAAAIQSSLNNQLEAGLPVFSAVYNANPNTITINNTQDFYFKILTDPELATKLNNTWTGPSYDSTNPRSANDLLRNYAGTSIVYGKDKGPFTSGFLDLQPIRNIFISSPNLGSFNTLGSKGEANIICKVPVNADFGYMVICNIIANHDFLNCSKQTLRTIEFHLKDVKGNYLPLHGGHCSFSIVFSAIFEDV